MNWHYKVLGTHTHVRVFMNGAACGNLCFRNEEFLEIYEAEDLLYSLACISAANDHLINFIEDEETQPSCEATDVLQKATATKIKDTEYGNLGSALYRLEPKLEDNEFVVVSSADVFGLETYIFAANAEGEITAWGELTGSQKDTDSHVKVLEDLGYTIK